MFEFTETISIQAPPAAVWDVLRDIEGWWLASNPEHDSLEHLDDRDVLQVGTRLRVRERIGGIPGDATGTITNVESGSAVTWEAPEARYRWFGMPATMGEGVTWRIQPGVDGETTILSAHVWASFPRGLRGRLMESAFTRLFHGVEKDRKHARTELQYLKNTIERVR